MFSAIFFFKQKTAYEMRISDWSSDVCSSDLSPEREEKRSDQDDHPTHAGAAASQRAHTKAAAGRHDRLSRQIWLCANQSASCRRRGGGGARGRAASFQGRSGHYSRELGRASCRGRVCQYEEISVVSVSSKKKNINITN